MAQIPPRSPTKLRHNNIARTQQVNIEINMRDFLLADIDLRDVSREIRHHLTYRRDLQTRADDDDQVDFVLIVVRQALGELVWERFAEECDVWFHDACFGDVVGAVGVGVGGVGVVVSAFFLILTAVVRAFAFHRTWLEGAAETRETCVAAGDPAGSDVGEDGFSWHGVRAGWVGAGCGGEGAMALD